VARELAGKPITCFLHENGTDPEILILVANCLALLETPEFMRPTSTKAGTFVNSPPVSIFGEV